MSQAIFHGRNTAPARPVLAVAAQAIADVLHVAAREWRVRQDLRAVSALTDQELGDVGIGPGGQESAVRHGRRAVRPVGIASGPAAGAAAPALPSSWTEWR